MNQPLIAVTGATGKIGGAVAEMLCEGGLEARLLVRDACRAPGWAQDVAVTGYADRATAASTSCSWSRPPSPRIAWSST